MVYASSTFNVSNTYGQSVLIDGKFKMTLSGTWSGTATLQTSYNGVEWSNVNHFSSNTTKYYEPTDRAYYRMFASTLASGSINWSFSSDEGSESFGENFFETDSDGDITVKDF